MVEVVEMVDKNGEKIEVSWFVGEFYDVEVTSSGLYIDV